MIQRSPVFLTDEHTAQGLEWLRAKRCPLTLPAGVLDSFSHFTFRGEAWVTDQGYGWASAVPVWRVHLADGRAFDYYANAWQSGNGNDCYWQWVNDTPATPDPVTPDPVTTFGTLHPDGTLTNTRVLARSDILACPHVIFVPEHYREDGSCRCDDPGHGEMAEWGYKWEGDAGKWIAP